MRILHIIPSLNKGGAERMCIDICKELVLQEEIEIKIILLHPENDFRFLTENINIEICTSGYRHHILKKNEFDFRDFGRIINNFQPHIIHSHLFEAEFFSRSFLISGVSYFSHLHGNMPPFKNFGFTTLFSKKIFTNYMEKRYLLKKYEACQNIFIANSRYTYNYFKKTLPERLSERLHYLPNAIRLSEFPYSNRKFPLEKIQLISTGSLVTNKNHSFLINVINLLQKTKKVHLAILGDGPLRHSLQSKIDSLQLDTAVKLQGDVDRVEQWLHQATVYVHASKYESFSLAILEAMATGLPVVCLDGGGNRELMEDGKNGFILKETTPQLFAEKILKIVSNEETYHFFSENARATAAKYDMKDYANRLLSLYKEALRNH